MDDDALVSKAEALLRGISKDTGSDFRSERLLVAVVLLTRVQENDRLNHLCRSYPVLHTFVVRILLSGGYETIFVRVALAFVSKCASSWLQGKNELQLLLQSLVRASELRMDCTEIELVDVELVLAMHDCLDIHLHANTLSSEMIEAVLSTIWHRFEITMGLSLPQKRSTDDSLSSTKEQSNDWHLLRQTLTAVLSQSHEDGKSLSDQWNATVASVLQRHGSIVCLSTTKVPSFYVPLVTFCTSSQTGSKSAEWYGAVLSCTGAMASSQTSSVVFSNFLMKEENKAIVSFLLGILFSMVTTQEDTDVTNNGKRAVAWETLGSLVDGNGWEWMLHKEPPLGDLGRASSMCGLLRMATGEWRIQLGLFLEHHQDPKSSLDAGDSFVIVEACGRVIMAAMHYMMKLVQIIEERGDEALPLGPDALLQVRHSLRDALHATLEYWLLFEDKSASLKYVTVSICSCRVLGALLPEMTDDLPHDIESTLTALKTALLFTQRESISGGNDAATASLLPALVTVLSSTDASTLLHHELIIGDVVQDSVIGHLNRLRSQPVSEIPSPLTWSCHVLEVWCDVAKPAPRKKRHCARALLPWVQYFLDEHSTSVRDKRRPALSTTIDCYMMLMEGSSPSSDEEKFLIARAL